MRKIQVPEASMDEPNDAIILPAAIIQALAPVYQVSTTEMARLLGMSRHVVWRKIHRREVLPAAYQARAMGAIRLYAKTLDLYSAYTVNRRQEARQWLNDWLRAPRAALGGRKPIELLGSDSDQKAVWKLVAGIAAGVYM